MKKRKIITLLGLGIIVISCATFIIHSKLANWNSEKTIDIIKEKKVEHKIKETSVDIPIDFEAAWEINQDIIAWIKIPNTTVDYPILQNPNEDNYYINRNVQRVQSRLPGSIYINLNNKADFTDNNTIIYGHNIRKSNKDGKGTMFGDLELYYDKTFFEKNSKIFIYTPKHIYTYEIFAAVTYNNKLIPVLYNLNEKSGYQDFLDSLYNTNGKRDNYSARTVTVKDKIITLSTCTINHDHNYRYLVTAVLIEKE